MYREDEESSDNVYVNEVIRGKIGKDSTQGSDYVKIRNFRAATVCLVLLCVLLLTAVIVLTQQFISKNVNMTNERDQLILKNINLTNEREQLRNELLILDGWTYYQFSFYYMPTESKNWNESRRYCIARGANLIIINNREEQEFVKNIFGGTSLWIGLNDIDAEGIWKWVDGSGLMTSGFWGSGEPNGYRTENCGVIVNNDPRWPTLFGWHDAACSRDFQWICEKRISQLILPSHTF